jgi:hypothetical protein
VKVCTNEDITYTENWSLSMFFKDLDDLSTSQISDFDLLKRLLPNTPGDIIEQVYSDHGRNIGFQNQYKDMDLCNLNWTLVDLPGEHLILASIYDEFQNWFDTCVEKSKRIELSKNWHYLHKLEEVCSYWEENKTWDRAPVFLKCLDRSCCNQLHLVEGHSRLGALKGLLLGGTLLQTSLHRVWVAEVSNSPNKW